MSLKRYCTVNIRASEQTVDLSLWNAAYYSARSRLANSRRPWPCVFAKYCVLLYHFLKWFSSRVAAVDARRRLHLLLSKLTHRSRTSIGSNPKPEFMNAPPFAASESVTSHAEISYKIGALSATSMPVSFSMTFHGVVNHKRTLSRSDNSREDAKDGSEARKKPLSVKRACNECCQQKVCTGLLIAFQCWPSIDSYSSVAMSSRHLSTRLAFAADASSLTARSIPPSKELGSGQETRKWRRRYRKWRKKYRSCESSCQISSLHPPFHRLRSRRH